ncbi:hypothetical protein [Bacillus sp. T33-2]|uniref:hypothetical protein n=1 Tax=Bacillus sp. T33-2 TaxID=2054168 RepID=UPI000C776056|nr:hypothetical protein [Bacillus sp. T33-2]PLR98755.1 hypothetical protein CVD19_03710 [Bacillus sp. T33-2]
MLSVKGIGFLVIFIIVHLCSKYLTILHRKTLSKFLSMASGVSVSYIFIHLLPKLNKYEEITEPKFGFIENTTYYFAMIGLVSFSGLERVVRRESNWSSRLRGKGIFWIHLISFSVYNSLIGYILVRGDNQRFIDLVLYIIAIAIHFISVNHGLSDLHNRLYDKFGRWILTFSIAIGWATGAFFHINAEIIGVLFGFLSGSILLNVIKEELPVDRESNYWAFASGIVLYSFLLFLMNK